MTDIISLIPDNIMSLIPRNFRGPLLRLYYKFRSPFYAGNNVFCPVCGHNFDRFIETLDVYNVVCPGCGIQSRHRLLYLYLEFKTEFFVGNLKVLHIAPEYILQKKFQSLKNIEYVSADLNSPVAMLKMDLTDIHLDDNTFDVILCYHVLEHIPDDKKAISEIYRILKPNGWAILQSPIDQSRRITFEDLSIKSRQDRKKYFGQADHVRIYGQDYYDRLTDAGFFVERDDFVVNQGKDIIKKYGLDCNENICLCKKH